MFFHQIENPSSKLEENIISELIEVINDNIGDNLTKKESRNLFTVIIEIIQNIQKYAIETEKNYFEIGYDEDQNIVMNSYNIANKENKDNLLAITDKLYGKQKAEVKEIYEEIFAKSEAKTPSKGLGTSYIVNNSIRLFTTIKPYKEDLFEIKLKVLY